MLSKYFVIVVFFILLIFLMFNKSIHTTIIQYYLKSNCAHGPKIVFTTTDQTPIFELGSDKSSPAIIKISGDVGEFWSRLLLYSDVGLGEMYMEGKWSSPDLLKVLCHLYSYFRETSGNEDIWTRGFSSLTGIKKLVSSSISEDKARISHHYDVGNDFYDTFLKKEALKAYTCGFYDSEECDLNRAQHNKADIIIEKMGLKPGMKIADIGCGWGEIANYIATKTGCQVVGLTISDEQIKHIQNTYSPDKVGIIRSDYRDLLDPKYAGTFDRVYSIGMLEHVRHENMATYFQMIKHILKPGGKAVIHNIITFTNTPKESVKDGTFITKHIFPGGQIPMHDWVTESVVNVPGLHISHTECFGGQHYARTCRDWRNLMFQNMTPELIAKYGEETVRKYDYYLASSSAGFSLSMMGLGHIVIVKDETSVCVQIKGQYFRGP
jgi:cyclopropane-fatty-acyl-phospholipid synthase